MASAMRAGQLPASARAPTPSQRPSPAQAGTPLPQTISCSKRQLSSRKRDVTAAARMGPRVLVGRASPPPPASISSADELSLAAQAVKDGTLGVGFSAGGLLFPYFVGVMVQLQEMGVLRADTPVAGASAGSLVAACAKSGLGEEEMVSALMELAARCRRLGTRHNLGPVLHDVLWDVLPDDIHERASTGGVHVAVTRVLPQPQPVLVSSYSSKEDLIQALLTSCHIPWYFNGALTTRFRGDVACDGGLTNFLPSPTGAAHTVRVCCFPESQMSGAFGRLCISPDTYEAWPHDMRTMLRWAFEPADDDTMLALLAKGRRDALAWAERESVMTVLAPSAAAANTPWGLGTLFDLVGLSGSSRAGSVGSKSGSSVDLPGGRWW